MFIRKAKNQNHIGCKFKIYTFNLNPVSVNNFYTIYILKITQAVVSKGYLDIGSLMNAVFCVGKACVINHNL